MDNGILRQLRKLFGKSWVCKCGAPLQAGRIEIDSKGKNSSLARYSCQVCGREQVFVVSLKFENEPEGASIVEVPAGLVSSDDVLDIKKEAAEIKLDQIEDLAKARKKSLTSRTVRSSPKF